MYKTESIERVKPMIRIVCIICFLLITQAVSAENTQSCHEQHLNAVAAKIGLKKLAYRSSVSAPFEDGRLIIAGVCKAWPWDPQKVLAAIAYYPEGHKFDEVSNIDDSKNFVLAIISAKSDQVLSSRQWVARTDIGPESLKIDTARYDFAPGVRAFGLDIFENHRQVTSRSGQGGERTLYIEDGNNIKPVLRNFILRSWQTIGENMGVANRADQSTIHTAYHIIVDQRQTNGFKNLIIKKTESHGMDNSMQKAHKQKVLDKKVSIDRVMYFNGIEYVENKGT